MASGTLKRLLERGNDEEAVVAKRSRKNILGEMCSLPRNYNSSNASSSIFETNAPAETFVKEKLINEINFLDPHKHSLARFFAEVNLNEGDLPNANLVIHESVEDLCFTQQHLELITARLVSKYESALREHFDVLLSNRLANQYERYVESTLEQIQKRYELTPSYVS